DPSQRLYQRGRRLAGPFDGGPTGGEVDPRQPDLGQRRKRLFDLAHAAAAMHAGHRKAGAELAAAQALAGELEFAFARGGAGRKTIVRYGVDAHGALSVQNHLAIGVPCGMAEQWENDDKTDERGGD